MDFYVNSPNLGNKLNDVKYLSLKIMNIPLALYCRLCSMQAKSSSRRGCIWKWFVWWHLDKKRKLIPCHINILLFCRSVLQVVTIQRQCWEHLSAENWKMWHFCIVCLLENRGLYVKWCMLGCGGQGHTLRVSCALRSVFMWSMLCSVSMTLLTGDSFHIWDRRSSAF